ncbi:adenylosuccinate synthase [Dethiosulfovibrio sp. F2B]|uniref:adenylosuccinate synthase n=1 Tax=Dethiosulfovibrio faecalis TaxID=2720018 RepID=UPI001F3DAEF8|nr:adenylosuccinate synthase [Dethiosulfovibrio faecalis]MCF4150711.1 adenylosuccinate synthase [Dethiosulfovibrio faecalis]
MKGKVEAIIGAQWGDEGKGRVVDSLGDRVDVFARYQGGANAGHTVIVEGEKHVFHLLPSGMLYSGKTCVIGNGVVLDPEQLLNELSELQEKGEDRSRLVISGSAHVVMPYHKKLDQAQEASRDQGSKIGTTGRGIGPCYVDKYNRCGIRVEDLLDPEALREKLESNLDEKNLLFTKIYDETPLSFDEIYRQALSWGKSLAPYVDDASLVINDALNKGQTVLLEGAQGTLLDVDHGTYPMVTSSSPTSAGGCVGLGVAPHYVEKVYGVVKAYLTRVGEGPFPSEDKGDTGQYLRDRGGEYGATTGRPRKCGWLDMVALRYAVRINGMTHITLTKLDVLTGLREVKVCVAYRSNGKDRTEFNGNVRYLNGVEPVYRSFPGWDEDISSVRDFDDLPEAARAYVRYIEEETGVPVSIIGVGPERDQMIVRDL